MRTRKIFATALLTLTVLGGTANAAFARQGHGADDPAGHVRHGGGADDGPNHG